MSLIEERRFDLPHGNYCILTDSSTHVVGNNLVAEARPCDNNPASGTLLDGCNQLESLIFEGITRIEELCHQLEPLLGPETDAVAVEEFKCPHDTPLHRRLWSLGTRLRQLNTEILRLSGRLVV